MLLPITAVQQRQRDNLLAAAAFLASGGADFVVVGGCALVLHGCDHEPHDLDLVPEPSAANLRRVFDRIAGLGTLHRVPWPTGDALATRDMLRRLTPVGAIDVLLRTGRCEYDDLARRSTPTEVGEQILHVAAFCDVVQMRERFGKARDRRAVPGRHPSRRGVRTEVPYRRRRAVPLMSTCGTRGPAPRSASSATAPAADRRASV